MTMLPDQHARDVIDTATNQTLFVNAGAGSGKTKHLVDRVATMVLVDGIELGKIAAVTFTEKAGAELRDRLRARFEAERRAPRLRDIADNALADLDTAAIGTLHSFAQRILTAHPIEAGLPPLIEVLDEVGSSVAFDERWSVLQRQMLDDPQMTDAVVLALSAGVKFEALRSLTRALGYDWDLIERHVVAGPAQLDLPDVTDLAERAIVLAERASECRHSEDLYLKNLHNLKAAAGRLQAASTDSERFAALLAFAGLSFAYGRKGNWPDLAGLKESCALLIADADRAKARYADATLRPVTYWLAQRVRSAAMERAAEGRLEFHDLLVLARDVLRRKAEVRAALQADYPYLLLDEFQDTDPIQIEIAVRIAGGAAASAEDWHDIDVPPGSLFLVGDPKQSIYRFRRASIRTYLDVGSWIGTAVTLSSNFRSTAPVLDWINTVFSQVIQAEEGKQPAYQSLDRHRRDTPDGPPVVLLGAQPHQDEPIADVLREREAADVAAVIGQAISDGWAMYDTKLGRHRPLEYGDIAVLLPARTSLPALEDALERGAIPYRAESSSLVYQAAEVRELMAAARAIADPSDLLSCVTALRSSLFGCGDDDLWSWKRGGHSFNLLAPVDAADAAHPVGSALTYLRRLAGRSTWMSPSELLAALVSDRRMLEVAATAPRARDQWRRLRFVVDQARAWSEVQHGGLRAYLAWAARQADETARVAEAVLPETDVNAIRVMTVHAAKGLEFPMVVLSGMTSAARTPRGVRLIWTDNGYAVRLTSNVQTNDFEAAAPLDEQMDKLEKRRLMYVAATRARDHLVVSLHHKIKRGGDTNARLLAAYATDSTAVQFEPTSIPIEQPTSTAKTAPPEFTAWLRQIRLARNKTRLRSAISASGLEGTDPDALQGAPDGEGAEGWAKGGRDIELPPWSKGRYGSAIGRAVHSVLQSVDLATGDGLGQAVAAQAAAEGVVEYAELVQTLARSALDSDLIRRAAARPYWRESYIGTVQPDGGVLEGFVDLIYQEDDGGWVIVDYKTDAIPAAAVQSRVNYYRPQITAYHDVLATATGSTAVRGELLFVQPDRALSAPVRSQTDARVDDPGTLF